MKYHIQSHYFFWSGSSSKGLLQWCGSCGRFQESWLPVEEPDCLDWLGRTPDFATGLARGWRSWCVGRAGSGAIIQVCGGEGQACSRLPSHEQVQHWETPSRRKETCGQGSSRKVPTSDWGQVPWHENFEYIYIYTHTLNFRFCSSYYNM